VRGITAPFLMAWEFIEKQRGASSKTQTQVQKWEIEYCSLMMIFDFVATYGV
jgi:hypothetical protein